MGGCNGCSTKKEGGLPTGCRNNGWCSSGGCGSILDVHDWLSNVYYVDGIVHHPVVEVKFKGTRKEYFKNTANIELNIGDAVVVESQTSGYDVGYVSLTGDLVKLQMKKYKIEEDSPMMKRVARIATESDLQKYEEAKEMEMETMMHARRMASGLGLVMKISDVEYQGDKTKATFFYTAEGRVDFRELIKLYAKEFRVKIEMRQIGLRQEAGRLGGIGSCGRELCCSTWLTDFHSVPTTAARYQNLFLNPLKLSGQCGRLKCCLNYELDTYMEALEEFPEENTILKTEKGVARVEKMDILKKIVWFRYDDIHNPKFYPLEIEKVNEILMLNKNGTLPADLDEFQAEQEMPVKEVEFKDVVGEDSLDRFENKKKKQGGNKWKNKKKPGSGSGQPQNPENRERNTQNRPNPEARRDRPAGSSAPETKENKPQNRPQQQQQQQNRDRKPQGDRPQNQDRNENKKPGGAPPNANRDNRNPNNRRPRPDRRDRRGPGEAPNPDQNNKTE